jgi:DNA-binding transcriptional regulator YiaG
MPKRLALTKTAIEAARPVYIESASTPKVAATLGVNRVTVWSWIDRARNDPDAPQIYRDFLQMVEESVAEWESNRIKRIEEAGEDPKHWTANAWLLERNPFTKESWARVDRVELTGKNGDAVQVEDVSGRDKIVAALEAMAARQALNRGDDDDAG